MRREQIARKPQQRIEALGADLGEALLDAREQPASTRCARRAAADRLGEP
jgi:hypothetical protein